MQNCSVGLGVVGGIADDVPLDAVFKDSKSTLSVPGFMAVWHKETRRTINSTKIDYDLPVVLVGEDVVVKLVVIRGVVLLVVGCMVVLAGIAAVELVLVVIITSADELDEVDKVREVDDVIAGLEVTFMNVEVVLDAASRRRPCHTSPSPV